ncbi:BrnA antitoxin family protein [Halomonas ramblicola]|uniref:BrnA antitoxin family protein n=1 Tax=Halomonas ramblicola TaxID=747349 RepID=UPI0025B4449F|nr:BrnA antitoxin family protein [Halomonas ramblicola]MDN3521527.1 BrnA antitoxin family protein [Halomonas ramblicola]
MSKRRDPEMIDDDTPEWTDEDFERARPASEVLPELFGHEAADDMLKPRRGRPKAEHPKEHITIRLDQEVVEAFRDTGPGWQTRVNQALKRFLQEHSPSDPTGR